MQVILLFQKRLEPRFALPLPEKGIVCNWVTAVTKKHFSEVATCTAYNQNLEKLLFQWKADYLARRMAVGGMLEVVD